MRRLSKLAVTAAVATIGLSAVGGLEAKPLPTARNSWRVQCQDGIIVDPFGGTYGEAVQVPCAQHGGARFIWDNGLKALGLNPAFSTTRRNFRAVEPEAATRTPAAKDN
jgi:hypothetical protein